MTTALIIADANIVAAMTATAMTSSVVIAMTTAEIPAAAKDCSTNDSELCLRPK